jgi:EAL domain-containing protein (putative c-di-GMP-specific phosphodiesterase class I)
MTRPTTTHAHPICPTCESDLTGREALGRLASNDTRPLASDNLSEFYEETARLVRFLGALAEAAPHAAAAQAVNLGDTPEWVTHLSWLAEDLTQETVRRLDRLLDAGGIWENHTKCATGSGKEG